MLALLKQFTPYLFFALIVTLGIFAVFGKPRWLFLLTVFLLPLRNITESLYAFPIGTGVVNFLFACLLIGCVWAIMAGRHKFFDKGGIVIVSLLMIIYMLFSYWHGNAALGYSSFFDRSDVRLQDWKNFALLPVLFFLTFNLVQDKKFIGQVLAVMVLSIFLMNYYTVSQVTSFSDLESRVKIKGTFVYLGPNEIAAFYNVVTAMLMGLFLFIKNRWQKILLGLLILTNIYCIMFLFSRGAYLGLAVGLFMLFALKKRALLIPLFLVILFWQTALPDKVKERIEQTHDEFGELDLSAQRRIEVWERSLELFSRQPIFGCGFGTFRYQGLDLGDTHNIYVKILVEQGVVGLAFFLILIMLLLRQSWQLLRSGDDPLGQGLGLGLFAGIFVLLVNNMFGDRWTYLEMSAYFWVFAGLVVRMNLLVSEQRSKSQEPGVKEKREKRSSGDLGLPRGKFGV